MSLARSLKWSGIVAGLVLAVALTRIRLPFDSMTREFAAIDQAWPQLPNILLIGDSIAIRYGPQVRHELKGKANVYLLNAYLPQRLHTFLLTPHVQPVNAGSCANVVRKLDEWLGNQEWDVIHFNCGLHVIPNVERDSDAFRLAARRYEDSLEHIVRRLQRTGATLIFASTTPIPAGTRKNADNVSPFNDIATAVMKRHNVSVNDLYAFALPRLAELQVPRDVHFHLAGSQVLAEVIARHIALEGIGPPAGAPPEAPGR